MEQPIPLVSVVMICRGPHTHLPAAVESILRQKTGFAVEIVLVTQDAGRISRQNLAELKSEDPDRIRVVPLDGPNPQYLTPATALHACHGAFVAFADSDSLWIDNEKLQKQVDYLENHSSYVACRHRVRQIDEAANVSSHFLPSESDDPVTFGEWLKHDSSEVNSVLVRRQRDVRVPFSTSELNGEEEWAWILLQTIRGDIGFINEDLSATRVSRKTPATSAGCPDWYRRRNRTLRRLRHEVGPTERKQIELQLAANHAAMAAEMDRQIRPDTADRHRRLCFLYGRWQAPLPIATRISHAIRPCRSLHAVAVILFEFLSAVRRLLPFIRFLITTLIRQPSWFLKIARSLVTRGGTGIRNEYRTLEYLFAVSPQQYSRWVRAFDTLTAADRDSIARRIEAMPVRPVFSIIMPVYKTPEDLLRRAIDSVISQLYPHWELCIADDASDDPSITTLLADYQKSDRRIRVETREERGNISAASNTALKTATGQFVVFLDHDDELAETALYRAAEEIDRSPQLDIIYSDEDRIDPRGNRVDPYFKTDWNPDLMLSHNMICHLAVIRRQIVNDVQGFRVGFEGSQDHDLFLRCIEQTTADRIRHIPAVLYHWRKTPGSVSADSGTARNAYESGARAIQEHLDRQQIDAAVEVQTNSGAPRYRVRYTMTDWPSVSVIIPTRDREELLRRCVDGLLTLTDYPDMEVLVIDNDSHDASTVDYLASMSQHPRVRVLQYHGKFNYSAINNYAVKHAAGEFLCLLNNDIEVIHTDWLREMVSQAARANVGMVGAKLFYPDGCIQHAGILVGYGSAAGHTFSGLPADTPVQHGRLNVTQNVSAVTAACMVLKRALYEEIGGLDEKSLAVGYNDVDLCLRVRAAGYRNVWTPYAQLYHYESASRRVSRTQADIDRDRREGDTLRRRWKGIIAADPNLNPNISIDHLDYRPAFPPRVQRPWH